MTSTLEASTTAPSQGAFRLKEEPYLHPTLAGSVAMIASLLLAAVVMGDGLPSEMARRVGIVVLGGIVISVLFDWRVSLRNLIRIDLFAIIALYYLTLAEFVLSDQPIYDETVFAVDTRNALLSTLLGFSGLVIGRHLIPAGRGRLPFDKTPHISPNIYFTVLIGSFIVANLYKWIAVDFSFVAWFEHMGGGRFSQPWQRGKLGNLSTLLHEGELLNQLIPPLVGLIYARRKNYNVFQLIIATVILLLTFFVGFAGGTRNVLAVNLAGLMGGYFIFQRELKLVRIVIAGILTAIVFFVLSTHQLGFRNMGLWKYMDQGLWKNNPLGLDKIFEEDDLVFQQIETHESGYFVDLNMRNIAGITRVFPSQYPYLGWNMPYVAFTKPIPRALWKDKPLDFKVSIEDALEVQGLTLSTTFIGEAYMMAGNFGVVLMGTLFGMFFMFWNRLGSRTDSTFPVLVYTAGFFAALITMRSMTMFTTALLPAIALLAFGLVVLPRAFLNDAEDEA